MSAITKKVQGGIDARTSEPILNAAAALSIGYATMLGLDGTSLDDAVERAYTPTGPSREVIRARIAFRRGLPAGRDGVAGAEGRAA
ncbi:hypothetical protein BRM3_09075 [Brachybacterium huguangmaarense]|uniref:ANTAR domain-containing protein n=1 Tax=Brachybacterium huguangmaarense TaxID=1652028 RepID=A0ABY6FY60_9MICO|nr:hypothetical protein [Brachybacterium huguangmaarense]UYG15797.1 hypothetical protein BRM3_09075 [Brachybacterium huguangmaarense]